MQLSELYLNRYLYRDSSQEAKDASFVSADSTPEEPTPVPAGGAAQDINTSNVFINGDQIEPGTIPQTVLDVSNWGWGQTSAFTSASATQVNWGAGTFTSAGGEVYSISAGNTGSMSAKTYIYLDLNVSETAYQTTTTSADSVGIGKVLIAVAENGASAATYMLSEATQIVGDNILANTIDASKITTGQLIVGTNVGLGTAQDSAGVTTIIGNVVTTGYVNALDITALGTVTAGALVGITITGGTIQTAGSGARVELLGSNNEINIYDSSVRRARGYQSGWTFYNPSGSTVADIYAGTTALGSASLLLQSAGSSGSLYFNSGSSGSVGLYVNGTAYLTASGSAGELIVNKDMMPVGTVYLGAITSPFESVWAENFAYNGTMNIVSGGTINVQGGLIPTSNLTYDLGSSSAYWDNVYVDDLYVNDDILGANRIEADIIDLAGGGYIDDARAIYLETGRTTNPSISGEIRYYDGSSKGFRGYVNGFLGQFDLSAV